MFFFFFFQKDWWDAKLEAAGHGFWLSYVPKVLLAIVIALMDEAYFKVAVWLNDMGMRSPFLNKENLPIITGLIFRLLISLWFSMEI